MLKRAFDVVFALATAVFWLPILAILGLIVRFQLGAPVFFRQQRPGLHGRPFQMLKFRSMLELRDASGNLLPDDLRITQFGRWLRSTSLDELPELFNVIKGEMSLVGPRPLLLQYLPRYSARHARRHDVLPGITGWAQVNGRNAISWEEKFELDIWYVENRSFWLDLKILFLTLERVFRRRGISSGCTSTVPEFMGYSHQLTHRDTRP